MTLNADESDMGLKNYVLTVTLLLIIPAVACAQGTNPSLFTVLSQPVSNVCTPMVFCQTRESGSSGGSQGEVGYSAQVAWCKSYAQALMKASHWNPADVSLIALNGSAAETVTRDDLVLLLRDVREALNCSTRWTPSLGGKLASLGIGLEDFSSARAQFGGDIQASEVGPATGRSLVWLDPISSYFDRSTGRLHNVDVAVETDLERFPDESWGADWGLNVDTCETCSCGQ